MIKTLFCLCPKPSRNMTGIQGCEEIADSLFSAFIGALCYLIQAVLLYVKHTVYAGKVKIKGARQKLTANQPVCKSMKLRKNVILRRRLVPFPQCFHRICCTAGPIPPLFTPTLRPDWSRPPMFPPTLSGSRQPSPLGKLISHQSGARPGRYRENQHTSSFQWTPIGPGRLILAETRDEGRGSK